MIKKPVLLNIYTAFLKIKSNEFIKVRYKKPGFKKISSIIFNESNYDINAKNVTFLFFELRKAMRNKSFKAFFKEL